MVLGCCWIPGEGLAAAGNDVVEMFYKLGPGQHARLTRRPLAG
jgi:hypothetical protein